jgi:hypothetical protein
MRWVISYAIVVVILALLWVASYAQFGKFTLSSGTQQSMVIASMDGILKIGRYERTVTGLGEGKGEVGRDIATQMRAGTVQQWARSVQLPQWPPITRALMTSSENVLYENGVVLTVTQEIKVTGVAWWMIVLIAAIPLAIPVLLSKQRLRRKRLRVGLCPECGYDLRATPDRCPECGWNCR